MTLLTKRILNTVWLKNFKNCSESYLIRTQYYTCLCSSFYVNSQKSGHQRISSLKTVRELNFDFKTVNGLLSGAFDKVFAIQKYKLKHIGFLWYKSLDEVNFEEFFNLLQMPDCYFSWFKVAELHVWMLLFRMNQDGYELRYIRDGVMEAMWLDMETRAKMIDMYNLNLRKQFLQFYEKFKISLFWYDYGCLEDDKTLASVVWSLFFERKCDDPEKLEALVRFIRCQIKHLQVINTKTLEESEKTGVWTPLNPHCKKFVT